MIPNNVITIREARRRVTRARKLQRRGPTKPTLVQRISDWLMHRTTRGSVLLAGLLAGLVMGALVASVLSAPGQVLVDQQVTAQP